MTALIIVDFAAKISLVIPDITPTDASSDSSSNISALNLPIASIEDDPPSPTAASSLASSKSDDSMSQSSSLQDQFLDLSLLNIEPTLTVPAASISADDNTIQQHDEDPTATNISAGDNTIQQHDKDPTAASIAADEPAIQQHDDSITATASASTSNVTIQQHDATVPSTSDGDHLASSKIFKYR